MEMLKKPSSSYFEEKKTFPNNNGSMILEFNNFSVIIVSLIFFDGKIFKCL